MPKIFFNYQDRRPFLKRNRLIREFVEALFLKENIEVIRVDYIFCSDKFLLKINKKFLNHSFYTDILTFNLSENPKIVKGEAYISSDRIIANSFLFKEKIQEEYLRVIFHGALHLCGYKDNTPKNIKVMRAKEDYYLQLFHVKHL